VRQHRVSANALIRLVLLHIVLPQERSKDRDYSAALGGMVCGIAIAAYIHLADGWALAGRGWRRRAGGPSALASRDLYTLIRRVLLHSLLQQSTLRSVQSTTENSKLFHGRI
jgi:hypothetical protein